MIGAVIGDLAAWIWEHDRQCFYIHDRISNDDHARVDDLNDVLFSLKNERET